MDHTGKWIYFEHKYIAYDVAPNCVRAAHTDLEEFTMVKEIKEIHRQENQVQIQQFSCDVTQLSSILRKERPTQAVSVTHDSHVWFLSLKIYDTWDTLEIRGNMPTSSPSFYYHPFLVRIANQHVCAHKV